MENEQIEAMQNFIQFARPIESMVFAPLFLFGATELPSQAMLRGLKPKREVEEVKLKEPEAAAVRLRSEKTRERIPHYGMWMQT